MKLLKSLAVALALIVSPMAASAATVAGHTLVQNQWIVLDMEGKTANLNVTPISKDGSFSFTYAFAPNNCGSNPWNCLNIEQNPIGVVHTNFNHNPAEEWFDKVNKSSVVSDYNISYAAREDWKNLLVYFRVTSGSGSISPVVDMPQPAPVPLPASALLLLAGMGGFAFMRRKRE